MEAKTAHILEHHWALDRQATEQLVSLPDSNQLVERVRLVTEQLDSAAVAARDENRRRIGDIFTRQSDEQLIVIGPCSLDADTGYKPLYNYIEELQAANPKALVALRANGAKPRTSGNWTGMYYSTDPQERQRLFEIYDEAFQRHIPVMTEVTQAEQLGAFAPWLSGIWIGARDRRSTALRTAASAIHLPVGVKNGVRDSDASTVKEAVTTIGKSSRDNEGSGVQLGTIAETAERPGIGTGILPVGEGNHEAAIIARGYKLPEGLSSQERQRAALEHLGALCTLGADLRAAVLVDATHGVPPMFDIPPKNTDRLPRVLQEISQAIERKEIANAQQLVGLIAEVGPTEGRTDPNYPLDDTRKEILSGNISNFMSALDHASPESDTPRSSQKQPAAA